MKLIRFSAIALVGMMAACSPDSTTPEQSFNPTIDSVRISERWNLSSQRKNIIEVRSSDPQGPGDLHPVVLQVKNGAAQIVFEDSLYDDGGRNNSSDVIAGDAVFRNVFQATAITPDEGLYSFTFTLTDQAGNSSQATQADIQFAFNARPVLKEIVAPDQLPSGSQSQIITAEIEDADGLDDVQKVTLNLLQNNIQVTGQPIELSNKGDRAQSGDVFANDAIFSLRIDSTFAAGRIGDYTLEFTAIDRAMDSSATQIKTIFLENKTGKILNVNLPSSMNRPDTVTVTMQVSDPQGLADIDSVFFKSQSGNPILLRDNGQASDQVEGDGIFSTYIITDINVPPAVYTFTFNMTDKVGNKAEAVVKSIEVKQ